MSEPTRPLTGPLTGPPVVVGPDTGRGAAPGSLRRLAARTAVVALVVVGVLAAAALVWTIRSVLGLIFIGFFLALGVDPAVSALGRRLHRRGLAVLGFVVIALVVVVVLALIVVTPAVDQLSDLGVVLAREVPKLVAEAQDSNTSLGRFANRPEVSDVLKSLASSLPGKITSSVNGIVGLVGSTFAGIAKALAVLALTLYFVLAMPRILRIGGNMVGGGEHASVLRTAASKVGGYVTGQLTVCAAAGVAAGIFFSLAHVPYPIVLALAVAVLDAVPQIGATAGALVGTVVALTVSTELAVVTLVFFLAYQQTENYLIAPRLMSRAVNLSAPAVLIAVLIGGGVGGVVGALVAVPVTAAGKTVLAYAAGGRFARLGLDLGPTLEPAPPPRRRLRDRLRRRPADARPAGGSAAGAGQVTEGAEPVEDRVDTVADVDH